MKSFVSALDILATANNSLLSLYIPTVVGYVWGLLIKLEYNTAPVDPVINDGFVL